jgi:hypothetical protein
MGYSVTPALKTQLQLDSAFESGQLSDAEVFCQDLIAELEIDFKAHRELIREAYFRMSSILELQGKDGTSFRLLGQTLAEASAV